MRLNIQNDVGWGTIDAKAAGFGSFDVFADRWIYLTDNAHNFIFKFSRYLHKKKSARVESLDLPC